MAGTVQVGDLVIYGTNGLCEVEELLEKKLPYDEAPQPYYTLRPRSKNRSVIYIPARNQALVGKMRPLLDKAEIDDILHGVRGRAMEWNADRTQRHAAFRAVMARRDQEEMLLMIRCIFSRRQALAAAGKRLPGADEDILQSSEKLLAQEFSCSLGIPPESVRDYIDSVLCGE